MPWDRALTKTIVLKDGRRVTTLSEVRELIASIPHREGAVWRYIGELLKEAANDRATVSEIEEILLRGLKSAGLL
jgi:hypothetical protein